MSKGWRVARISDVCDIVGGGTPAKDKAEYYSGRIPWATVRDMKNDLLYSTEFCITKEAVDNSATHIIEKDNIVIATRVGLGKVCILAQDTAINQDLKGIIPKDFSTIIPKFLFMWFRSVAHEIIAEGKGATVQGVTIDLIGNMEIPLPPLPEQKRIVKILDEAFAGIATAKANAEKNLENAKAIFDSYLQGIFTDKSIEWENKRLCDIALDFGRGKSKHRPRNDSALYGGKYPFIQTGDIRNSNHIITSYSQTYSDKGLSQSKLWPKGTLCITIAANIAETAILGFDSCFPDSVIGVVVDPKKADTTYLEFLLQRYKIEMQALGKGSAQDNINLATFEEFYFPFPSVKNQVAIAKRIHDLMSETQVVAEIANSKIAELDALKKSILNEAFNGNL